MSPSVVTHTVSASSDRFERMSPWAFAMALLLHVALGLAAWWMATALPAPAPAEEAIEVTLEQPKPKPPPPPPLPPPQAIPAPAPVSPPGLRPPAEITSEKPTQVPPKSEPSKDATAPQPETRAAVVPPVIHPEPPAPAPKPQPPVVEPPKAMPAPRPAPQNHAMAVPPPPRPSPLLQHPELLPSPLRPSPLRQAPTVTPRDNASAAPFVNPADTYNRARVADNYLWQVVRKLIGYSYHANVRANQGITVVRVVIARDGRLLDVAVAQSSGYPEFDRGVLAGVRAGSPYAPLPPEIHGASATFSLPLVSVQR